MDVIDTGPEPATVAALFAEANDRPEHMVTEFKAFDRAEPEQVRTLTGRNARRRAGKASCCVLCDKPMTANDRMPYRMPDPRPERWGLMTTADCHPRCIAKVALRRAEAAERALAELSEAAKARKAATETTSRQQALGLWTPR